MSDGGNLHVVVFPWLAFGHMMPFMELSKALAKKGHKVSYLSTQRNTQRLPKIPPSLAPLIDLVELPLPPVEGLPDGAEATIDLPPDKVEYLKKAFDGLEPAVVRFFEQASPQPDWLIHDFAQHWISAIAVKSGVPCAYLSMNPPFSLAFFRSPPETIQPKRTTPEDFLIPPKWIPFPTTVAYRLHEARSFMGALQINASGLSDIDRFEMAIQNSQAMLIRDCEELNGEWIHLLQGLYKKQIVPVGFLPPSIPETVQVDGGSKVLEWLDKQRPGSTVYIAFGSEATITVEQVHELALGLELSQHPFLWALRKPYGMPENATVLPEGFEDRTSGRGLVAMGWVPQLNILAHKSIGGFLTHCGWSSVLEAIHFGHPLIALPLSLDQGLISRFIVEKKMGFEVERNEEDGSFTKDAVAQAVRIAMDEENGKQYRLTVKQMNKIFAKKDLNDRYIDGFISFLTSSCVTK